MTADTGLEKLGAFFGSGKPENSVENKFIES